MDAIISLYQRGLDNVVALIRNSTYRSTRQILLSEIKEQNNNIL